MSIPSIVSIWMATARLMGARSLGGRNGGGCRCTIYAVSPVRETAGARGVPSVHARANLRDQPVGAVTPLRGGGEIAAVTDGDQRGAQVAVVRVQHPRLMPPAAGPRRENNQGLAGPSPL